MLALPQYAATADTNRPRALIQYSGIFSWQTFTRTTGLLHDRTPMPPQQAVMHMIQQESQHNQYLAFQSGVASSVFATPRPAPHRLGPRTKAPRLQPLRPPRPPM